MSFEIKLFRITIHSALLTTEKSINKFIPYSLDR